MHKSAFLFAIFLSASFASAQKHPMTFEDMMAMKRLGDTAVSPDGKWLAYSVTTVNLEADTRTPELFLQPIAGGDAQPLLAGKPGDSGLQFSPDGHSVLFVSGRQGGQQIWLADFDSATGATTNARKLTGIATGADSAKWAPDSKSIVFLSAVYPDCPAINPADGESGNRCNAERDAALAASKVKAQIFTHLLYRHWNHFTGDKRSHLFQVLVDNDTIRDLTPNDPHDVPPFSLEDSSCGCALSPDSKELAFTENLDPEPATSVSASIFTFDLTNPAAKPVRVSTSAGGNFNPAYSPDGKYLAWRSEAHAGYESDKFRLMLYDRAAKTSSDVLKDAKLSNGALANFDNWVDEFTWSLNSQAIFLASGTSGETELLQFELESNKLGKLRGGAEYGDLRAVPIKLDRPTGVLASGLLASMMKVDRPSEVVDATSYALCSSKNIAHYDKPCGDRPLSITHLNDALLAQLDLPKMESFWFSAADGTKVQGFLIRPPAFDPNKKYPVKFLIHGGPQGAWGDSWSYRWNPELFAANDYVVVMINPRGSTGYGQAFVDGVNGDWGGKPFTDLMTGLDYAEQHYPFIDTHRECALGASYGGYMANWILGHTDRFKCIVSHDGMFNAESAFGSTEEDWFNIWEFKGHPWDYYGKPDPEDPFRKWSPSLSAKNFKTPTLVVHGQLDYRLDVSEGLQLFDTLQLLRVPSKMLYFPDEGHWVLKPQNARLWYKTVNDWVDQWTK